MASIKRSSEATTATPKHGKDESSSDQYELGEVYETALPAKYRGTVADLKDMTVLGKKQVLRRNFKFVSMIGFASTVIVSWEIMLPVFTFALTDGGSALLFWGFIITALGMAIVYASLAEMASMSPTAGGQYHWVSEFAPPQYQKILSYIVGWLTCIGWQVFLASVAFMEGTIIQGLIALNNEEYPFHPWHGTLLIIAVVLLAIFFNTLLAFKLPSVEVFALALHLAGLFAIIIPLWVMAPHASANTALFQFSNNGGWPSTGVSAMIGLSTPLSSLIGYDCSVHMSEEIRDASITLPRAMMWSVFGNTILAFIMMITLVFTMGDADVLLSSPTRQPFIQLFYNATQSYTATNIMTAIIVVLLTVCCISEVATASRQLWSLARDGALPGSAWLSVVPPRWNLPIRSVLVSFAVTTVLACINLGSTTALNAINSFGGVSVFTSYFITIACLTWRRLYGPPLPPRRWSLGRYGLVINIASLLFLIPIWFFLFWPLAIPVTPSNMNWASVMFVGTIIFALIWYWAQARHRYTGPVVQMKRELQD